MMIPYIENYTTQYINSQYIRALIVRCDENHGETPLWVVTALIENGQVKDLSYHKLYKNAVKSREQVVKTIYKGRA